MDQGFDAAFWDRMYGHHQAAHGEPNSFLARENEGLVPGTGLDVGCGEGADALWLANRGWRMTAVDFSSVAINRARVADAQTQVNWVQADMLIWQPPADAYDLVSLHYVHVPPAERTALFGRLAQAVRPMGTLLMVAHHPSDLESTIGRPPVPDLYFTAEEVAASLEPGCWEILVSGTRPKTVTDRAGQAITIHDMVLKARRIA
ncbi:tellurite resistance protein TehB [compost metagenome]